MEVIVDGLHIKGADSGRGPVALLLHGWGGDSKTMLGLKSSLGGYRVVAPDLPGFGGSQPPAEAWGADGYANFVVSFLKKANIAEVSTIIGHSFGGRIALELVGRQLIVPEKLILLASHGLPENRSLPTRLLGLAANIGRVLPAAWRSKVGRRFRSDDYRTTTGIMSQVFLKVIGQNASSVASKIKTETLLIYGNDDQTTPPAMGRQFNRLIVGSKLELVERAGHYVHLDQPGRVEKLIKDFIK